MGMKELYDFAAVFIESVDTFSLSSLFNMVFAGITAFVVFYFLLFAKNVAKEVTNFESMRCVARYKKFRTRNDSVSSEDASTIQSTENSTQTNSAEE